jgi:hypothetical protein
LPPNNLQFENLFTCEEAGNYVTEKSGSNHLAPAPDPAHDHKCLRKEVINITIFYGPSRTFARGQLFATFKNTENNPGNPIKYFLFIAAGAIHDFLKDLPVIKAAIADLTP